MKVFIYKNGLCDPAKKIGTCRQFGDTTSVDDFIRFFVASIDPRFIKNWRIFVTNDEVEFHEVDHFVLMDEPYGLGLGKEKVKEINIYEWAKDCNSAVQKIEARRTQAKAQAEKSISKELEIARLQADGT